MHEVLSVLKKVRPDVDFQSSTNFIEDGHLDSFDIICLVSELEARFKVLINSADILPENFSSLESISNLIEKKRTNNG